jgi:hypothetical protein
MRTPDDERQMATGPVHATADQTAPTRQSDTSCSASATLGCLTGQVIVAPFIYLDEKKYFDAAELGQLFVELVTLVDKKGAIVVRDQYNIDIAPEITNDSFKENFTLYVKGETAAAQKLSERGSYLVKRLTPGTYDVRVQKRFTLTLTEKEKKQPSPATPEPQNSVSTSTVENADKDVFIPFKQTYCFTIYSEQNSIEVMPGSTLHSIFDHFKLHMVDKPCQETADRDVVISISK